MKLNWKDLLIFLPQVSVFCLTGSESQCSIHVLGSSNSERDFGIIIRNNFKWDDQIKHQKFILHSALHSNENSQF
ncbi:hypothetical protein BpHYR1_011476 [Brachionus plicatilis]|uniref:Secreted protein n=1 Tax=Brachionus plicatilis TaxID=10195 RepID=A0A3M7QFH6_BRAPC|nr:hypothetical protein BpHYR1_011476 [Brachionus plicatilis]